MELYTREREFPVKFLLGMGRGEMEHIIREEVLFCGGLSTEVERIKEDIRWSTHVHAVVCSYEDKYSRTLYSIFREWGKVHSCE